MDLTPVNDTIYSAPDTVSPYLTGNDPYEMMDGDMRIMKFPDGTAVIEDMNELMGPELPFDPNNHEENLALIIPDPALRSMGLSLKQAIEDDKASQENFISGVAKIIELLGIQLTSVSDGDDDLPFKGASSVYSMALFESLLDLVATAISSLFPATGMADCVITGESDQQARDCAYRKKTFFNHFLTDVAKEFKKETKKTLLWAFLVGSCYKKVYIDPVLGRPTSMFIRPEDFIVNREYSTHLISPRRTHIIRMDKTELKVRQLSGMYRDIKITKQDLYRDEDGGIEEALNDVSGYHSQDSEHDESYCVYECHVRYHIKEDPKSMDGEIPLPYIISLDEKSGDILSIRRNWKEEDPLKEMNEYFVNYSMLTSLDGEGYGLLNYGGRQAEAATCLLRQLINTGTYANFPGGVYQAGMRIENNNIRPNPGEFIPIQTGGYNIEQSIKALPYPQPSPALKDLLVNIEDNIRKPSAIINQKVAEMTPRAPMGSVLALLESMQKIPNSVLQGIHDSFHQELMLWNARFAEWLPENQGYPFKVPGGDMVVMKKDFEDHIRVIPASDPSLQNSSFRFMQAEIILNQARQGGDLHNLRFAYEYFYKNMGLSPEDIKELLPPAQNQQPFSGDPITENQLLMVGKPVNATIMQDHDAHMMVHSLIINNPQSTPQQIAAAQAHNQLHEALKFLVEMQARIGFRMPEDPSQIPPDIQNEIAVMAAEVAQEKLKELQANQPKPPAPPIDPAIVGLESVKQKAEADAARGEIERMRLQLAEQDKEKEYELEMLRIQNKEAEDIRKSELEERKLELEALFKDRDLLIKENNSLKQQIDTTMKGLQ